MKCKECLHRVTVKLCEAGSEGCTYTVHFYKLIPIEPKKMKRVESCEGFWGPRKELQYPHISPREALEYHQCCVCAQHGKWNKYRSPGTEDWKYYSPQCKEEEGATTF